ncbi:MAG: EcsC family protein [Alphaproteobacteria bacterium]|nr:EcsC family protein [Alphaproteobacteria bacterium]MCB9697869.1 EcsC family protein [Alphaproteobacteria bacterium]
MPSRTRPPPIVADALDRADTTLIAGGYRAVSVSTERVRAWFRFRGLAFVDPTKRDLPSLGEVDRTADTVISRACSAGSAVGGATSVVGAAGVPPEVALSAVVVLRMAQRLCIAYGFDPSDDRGQAALARALAAAYGVDLPESGAVGLRFSDLPALVRPEGATDVGGRIARAMVSGGLWWAASRVTRFVPLISAPRQAVRAREQIEAMGLRMREVLRRLAEVPDGSEAPLEDAQEVGPDGRR